MKKNKMRKLRLGLVLLFAPTLIGFCLMWGAIQGIEAITFNPPHPTPKPTITIWKGEPAIRFSPGDLGEEPCFEEELEEELYENLQ